MTSGILNYLQLFSAHNTIPPITFAAEWFKKAKITLLLYTLNRNRGTIIKHKYNHNQSLYKKLSRI